MVFVLAQGRAHDVAEDYLGPDATGIMVVDRYKAYQAIDQVKQGLIVLAFCWAHVRRDFVTVARTWPDQEPWALGWVAQLGELYRLKRPAAAGPGPAHGLGLGGPALASGRDGLGSARGKGTDGRAVTAGAAEGAGELGEPRDGVDGVGRAPGGADG